MSTYTGVTNFQKTVRFLAYPVLSRKLQIEMLACLRAGQRDVLRRQADDDFGQWVKTAVLLLAVSGPKFVKFWDDVRDSS